MPTKKIRCIYCGETFDGYMITVCDKCLDKQKPDEEWEDFQARMRRERDEGEVER